MVTCPSKSKRNLFCVRGFAVTVQCGRPRTVFCSCDYEKTRQRNTGQRQNLVVFLQCIGVTRLARSEYLGKYEALCCGFGLIRGLCGHVLHQSSQRKKELMEVVTLPLPPSLRSKLQAAGYTTIDCNISPVQLARDVSITHEEALGIIKLLPSPKTSKVGLGASFDGCGHNAWDLFRLEKARRRIVTSCCELDSILAGGICTKEITEICGVPGVGKTQLGTQLAVNVQIPLELGGLGGHAVYIDTEGSFMVERVVQMTESCVSGILGKAFLDPQLDIEVLKRDTNVEKFLSRIYYFRIHDVTEQIAVINSMEKFLVEHKEVRLIVIDSVTFHFRQGFEDMAMRTRLLSTLSQKLMALAQKHDVAVVVVNQVTNKITQEGSEVIPALGESWSHACTNRLILYWMGEQRFASLYKSPSLPTATAAYDVSAHGITDAVYANKKAKHL